jgi:hypothetical protein
MKYQPGDKILVLHTNEEGRVVEIMNENMVTIEVNGVQFPAYIDQIDFPYFKMFTEKKLFDAKPQKKYIDDIKKENNGSQHKIAEGVWLSFLPVFDKDVFDDGIIEKFKLYLVNQTETAFNFTYNLYYSGNSTFRLDNQLEQLSDFYLHDIRFEDMSDNPRFDFEFSLVNPDKKKVAYFESSLKLKAKQLFKKIEEMQLKNEPTFTYVLFSEYPDFVHEEKYQPPSSGNNNYKLYDAVNARENLEPARTIIDLHIEKLTDSWKHLSNFEILTIQLKTFEKFYELSVAHYQHSLIVIHGVGTGKLKDEIHHILRNKKEVKSFVNQYHPNYGYGATEIYFSY